MPIGCVMERGYQPDLMWSWKPETNWKKVVSIIHIKILTGLENHRNILMLEVWEDKIALIWKGYGHEGNVSGPQICFSGS